MIDINEVTARCWAEIDLGALQSNFQTARALAGEAEVICVLKADAYGLGGARAGRALQKSGARFFAVASGDEAEELLNACPGARILVLGEVGEAQAARLIARDVRLTLHSARNGRLLARAARKAGRACVVHIKADTGLVRLGFWREDDAGTVAELLRDGSLRPEGLYTHLALHDRAQDEIQFERFDAFARRLEALGVRPEMRHCLDSIGLTRYPERRMDAVRVGAWLYGVTPPGCANPECCQSVATLNARIARIAQASAGSLIGYDDDHPIPRDMRVATLTCGYVDGVPRLNNVGWADVRGRRAPVVGLVCMDQMMADVSEIPEAREGDRVTLLGGAVALADYARFGRLNRNEALARIGRRVWRLYKDGASLDAWHPARALSGTVSGEETT